MSTALHSHPFGSCNGSPKDQQLLGQPARKRLHSCADVHLCHRAPGAKHLYTESQPICNLQLADAGTDWQHWKESRLVWHPTCMLMLEVRMMLNRAQ